MGLLTVLKKLKQKEKELRLLILGLDNAGKSTILKKFNGEDISTISPTLGFNIQTLTYKDYKLNIWDIGGQKTLRSYWRNYYEENDAVIWVIDSSDVRRIDDCKLELKKLLEEEKLAGASFLIFANKQDLNGALSIEEISKHLDLEALNTHHWIIKGCSAVTGDGLEDGIDWVVNDIISRYQCGNIQCPNGWGCEISNEGRTFCVEPGTTPEPETYICMGVECPIDQGCELHDGRVVCVPREEADVTSAQFTSSPTTGSSTSGQDINLGSNQGFVVQNTTDGVRVMTGDQQLNVSIPIDDWDNAELHIVEINLGFGNKQCGPNGCPPASTIAQSTVGVMTGASSQSVSGTGWWTTSSGAVTNPGSSITGASTQSVTGVTTASTIGQISPATFTSGGSGEPSISASSGTIDTSFAQTTRGGQYDCEEIVSRGLCQSNPACRWISLTGCCGERRSVCVNNDRNCGDLAPLNNTCAIDRNTNTYHTINSQCIPRKGFTIYAPNALTCDSLRCRGTCSYKLITKCEVLDLSRVLAGPWSTQIFGDLGADVIKVEHINKGDDTREWGPPFYKDPNGNLNTAYFSCTNRNKKSIAVDITKKEGQDLLHRLVKDCDVLVENFKVGGLKKYRLDYESIKEINPRLVYCSITGFGQTGPCKDLPGYDFAIQAMGGLMSITGSKEEPMKCGVAIVDIMTGLYANVAIQSALHLRNETGRGQHVDVSLLDVQATFLANQASNYLLTNRPPGRIGNSHPSISPYDSLKTKDGFIVVAVGNDSQFESMCNSLGLPHLVKDERFIHNSERVANRTQLLEYLSEKTVNYETDQLVQLFGEVNVPCSPINTFDKVYSHPQIKARNMVWEIPFEKIEDNQEQSQIANNNKTKIYEIEKLKVVGNPIHFSESDLHSEESIKLNTPPPTLGQHTDSVVSQLGYSANEIERLKQLKVIS
eukprot:gene6638-8211_t